MPQREELNVEVPFLGAANQDDNVEKQNQLGTVTINKQSNHWVHTVMIILLLASVGYIGYWGYDFNQDQQQRVLMNEATESRIAELEQLLSDFKAQEERSGQTLKQQLNEQVKLVEAQKKIMDTQYQEYEEKFAKLISESNNKKEEQLTSFNLEIEKLELKIKNAQEDAQDELGFMTSQQKTALASLEERLKEMDGIRTTLTNLEINETKMLAVQKGLVADIEGLSKEATGTNDKLVADITALQKEIAQADAVLEKSQANIRKSLRSLTSKVSVLAKKGAPKLSPAALARISKTENAIKAIDGTRAQVNKEIQRLKSKVNKIQLQLQ